MSAVHELLGRLRQLDIRLWAQGDRLRYDAPQGAMNGALQEELRAHKAELLAVLQKQPASDAQARASPQRIGKRTRHSALPLSFAQRRMWLHEQLHGPSATYNLAAAWQLSGALDRSTLARSLSEIVRRHESLRTTFATSGDDPVQIIHPPAAVAVATSDLTAFSAGERAATAQRLLTAESLRPFDLTQGPPLRALLLQLAEAEQILLVTFHHIVVDGWAIDLFLQELATLYAAYSAGAASPLAEPTLQYADFSEWQHQQLQGPSLERLLAYWREQLATAPAILELPTCRSRQASPAFPGRSVAFQLDARLTGQLRALGRKAESTLYMTLLAAFNVLLFRYSGQTDLLVSSPIAGRTVAEAEPLIAFFANTLVLRTQLSGAQTFLDLLAQVRQTTIAAFAHQELPFERLMQELRFERKPDRAPLVQVSFSLASAPAPLLRLGELRVEPMALPIRDVKWDLSLHLEEEPDGLRGGCEYRTDLFDAEAIERLLGHYRTLLAGIVAAPESSLQTLPLLTEAEKQQLLDRWNSVPSAAPAPVSNPECIHELFAQKARATPDAVAVVFASEQLTYRELDRRSSRLACYLQSRGIGGAASGDSLVGLYLERSLDMVVGLLGILKAGGAYVPLDPALPQERIAYMLADARITLAVTQKSWAARLPAKIETICLDSDWNTIEQATPEHRPIAGAGAQSLVYVIYTSGSTGRPKGVAVEHRQLYHYVRNIGALLELPPGARWATVSTLAADLGNTPIFGALCTGGTLIVLSYSQSMNPEQLAADLRAAPIDCLKITPSHCSALLSAAHPEHLLPRRALVLGGEALSWGLVEQVHQLVPRCRIYNEYGPTETTVGVLVSAPLESYERSARPAQPPAGQPLPGTQAYILDAARQPVPIGVPGEMYLGGAQVTRGYLHQPERTAERFVELRFSSAELPPQRAYRTGDLMRYLPSGDMEFLGRLDSQVKLRGYRVELGEIEAVLQALPEVREAVVVLRKEGESTELVAYVTPRRLDPESLRAGLAQKLPDYMVPGAIVTLESLPLTVNGKLDRAALPPPERAFRATHTGDGAAAPDPPMSRIEQALAAIWRELLNVPRPGLHDNFFKLGGDSILSIQMIARAHRAGIHLPAHLVFAHPTISGLATIATWQTGPAAQQSLVTGAVPLLPIQERFFSSAPPAPHHFNMSALHVVRGDLDPELLHAALRQLLRHHDALRLRFRRGDIGWEQWHAELEESDVFAVVDLAHLAPAEQLSALTAHASDLQTSLELERGPLIRLVYFTFGAGRSARLLSLVHHLIIDGVSWRILLEDLEAVYCQLAARQRMELPAKTTSFKEWAQWLKDHGAQAVAQDLPHWQRLAQAAVTPLPLDLPGDRASVPQTAQVSVALAAEATAALLQEVPTAYNTQINDVLLSALALTLADWTGASAFLIELEGHGREVLSAALDVSRTVGWFTSVFPVRLEFDRRDAGAAIKSIKEQLRQVPHRGMSYGILRYLQQDPILQRMPQAPIGFNYLGRVEQTLAPEGLIHAVASEEIGPLHDGRVAPRYLIDLNCIVVSKELRLDFIYSTAAFRRETIEQLAARYIKTLAGLIAHCLTEGAGGFTPSDFPDAALSQSELDALVAELG